MQLQPAEGRRLRPAPGRFQRFSHDEWKHLGASALRAPLRNRSSALAFTYAIRM